MSYKNIRLVVAIVNCGAGNRAATVFHACNHEILLAARGHSTAGSAVMDCLGLNEPEKDLVLGLSSRIGTDCLLRALGRGMEFCKPGRGITFTLSLTDINFAAMDILGRREGQARPDNHPAEHKEDTPMTNSHSYELAASVIHTDLSASVMETAKKVGCRDGTLIKVRETGGGAGKKLFGTTLSQEKTILPILTPASLGVLILKSMCEAAVKETGKYTVAVSLPMGVAGGPTG